MATINSIDSNIPIEISKGGTNATSMATSYGTVYYDSSGLATVASVGTSGQVLTSNGASSAPTFQDVGGSGVGTSAFLATATTNKTNVTGDNTPTYYQVPFDTEIYDVGSDYNTSTGEFVAPVTGKYYFCVSITADDAADWYSVNVGVNTSNIGYVLDRGSAKWDDDTRGASNSGTYTGNLTHNYKGLFDMDAADSAYGAIMCTNSNVTSNTVDVIGDATLTFFCGVLIG